MVITLLGKDFDVINGKYYKICSCKYKIWKLGYINNIIMLEKNKILLEIHRRDELDKKLREEKETALRLKQNAIESSQKKIEEIK